MEHTFEKEKMDSVKALAETNMKISEAKSALAKLQSLNDSYIKEREALASETIKNVLDESADLLDKTRNNYQEVIDLHRYASSLSTFVVEIQEKMEKLFESFDEMSVAWEKMSSEKENEVKSFKAMLDADKVRVGIQKDMLVSKEKSLKDLERLVKDRHEMLARTIKRMKNI